MSNEEIIENLKKDIAMLREPEYGYIRAGYPRFMALFGRDSCITSWQLIDYDPAIARDTIKILAKLQGKKSNNFSEEEPGKILHEWHPNPLEYKVLPWPLPYYGSVDATPLFLYLCFLYYEKTTDSKWLAQIWPHIELALEWCEKYGDLDGDMLIEYERKNPAGLEHQGWKDSRLDHLNLAPPVELVEVQGYYYMALMQMEELALGLKKTELAEKLRDRALHVRRALLSEFWLPDEEYFSMAISGDRIPDRRITSNPGHLLFSGILDGEDEKIRKVVEHLFGEDMWTPYGIRTHSTKNPDFNPMSYHLGSIWPHDNWIISQGLLRYGYIEEYGKIKEALLGVYRQLGKIPELYAADGGKLIEIPIAASPQAWASGALLNLLLAP